MADSEQKYLAFVIQQAFIFHLEYIDYPFNHKIPPTTHLQNQ